MKKMLNPLQKHVKDQKGFTMVEMLVVLVLVGLVVTFLFSVLGSSFSNASIQQSATKIADDMRSINDASQKYTLTNATQAPSLASLTAGGVMTTVPVPPATGGVTAYTWDNATYTATWGTAAADTVIKTTTTSINVCEMVNQLFAGAAAGTTPPAAVNGALDIQCFGAASPYTVLKTIYVN